MPSNFQSMLPCACMRSSRTRTHCGSALASTKHTHTHTHTYNPGVPCSIGCARQGVGQAILAQVKQTREEGGHSRARDRRGMILCALSVPQVPI